MSESIPTWEPERDYFQRLGLKHPHIHANHTDDFTGMMPRPVPPVPATDPANIPVMSEHELLHGDDPVEAMVRAESHNAIVELDRMEQVAHKAAAYVEASLSSIPKNVMTDVERDLYDAVQMWRPEVRS